MEKELENSILKTGTSLVGIVCKDGIVMAGDRKVTAGNLVMGKKEQKVVPINNYIVASWTGMVADAQLLKKVVAAELKLKELKCKTRPTVKEAANLFSMITFRNIRQFSSIPSIVGSLVGGFNEDGSCELYTIEPAGSIIKVEEYDANFSSGMPFILGFLERKYKKDLSVKEGVELAIEALKSSTQRDIGSGSGIDVFTITKDGIKHAIKQTIESEFKED
ncbi:proteasome subunit beta [Candidatus Pacearchaeota archaeon]|nr:proteasome subunit beta [Candidatus Pacearchaeota archaeon]